MENQVEEIKRKLDIVEIISSRISLKKRGRHFLACCPFHNEKTPSFMVSPELQIFKCFGCGKAGDIFTFFQEYEHVEFKEALKDLAKLAGITLIENHQLSQQESVKKKLIEINEQVALFYNYILTKHPLGKEALNYVLTRGITPATINQFKIGFSPSNSQILINFLTKKGFQKNDLITTGTFGQSQYGGRLYDRFQDRLIFPLNDYRNQVVGFSGRILPTTSRQNSAKYINSPETEIYHKSHMVYGLNLAKEAIRKENAVIVVEGEFDMISPYQSGIHNIVALKGTAFTSDQLQLLRRFTDSLILALDSDFAGDNAARKSIELADSLEFDIQVLTLGQYKDPDEAIKADPKYFHNQLKNTIPIWDFLIQSALKANDPSTIKGKKEILSTILPFISKITNSVIKSDYIKKLANEISSSEESVYQELQKYSRETAPLKTIPTVTFNPTVSVPVNPMTLKIEKLEEYLLTLIFGARKPVILSHKLENYLNDLQTLRLKTIASLLLSIKIFKPHIFETKLPAETRIIFQNLFMNATSYDLESKKRSQEIKKVAVQIKTILLKDQLDKLNRQISQVENTDDSDKIHDLELKYNSILSELSRLQAKKT